MNIEGYKVTKHKKKKHTYEFISRGGRSILKVVELQAMEQANIFNLAMGDIINGEISYSNITNNKDTDTIMQTIANIVVSFTSANSARMVYVTGDTPVKTRLYQRYLSNNLTEVEKLYQVWGLNSDGTGLEKFTKGKNYEGFLVKRR